jgi:hypothetical protein
VNENNKNNNNAPMKEEDISHRRGFDTVIEFRTVMIQSRAVVRQVEETGMPKTPTKCCLSSSKHCSL